MSMSKSLWNLQAATDGGKRKGTGKHFGKRGRVTGVLAWVYSRLNLRSVAKLTRQEFFTLGFPLGYLLQQFCGKGVFSGEPYLACETQRVLTEEGGSLTLMSGSFHLMAIYLECACMYICYTEMPVSITMHSRYFFFHEAAIFWIIMLCVTTNVLMLYFVLSFVNALLKKELKCMFSG